MRRPLLAMILMLLAAGCSAPRAVAEEEGEAALTPTIAPRATQVAGRAAGRLSSTWHDMVVPAGLTLLPAPALPRARPAVVRVSRPLQCVPYARELSGIALRGDAWTWWSRADGRYAKGRLPQPGAVLVFSKTRRLKLGHLAVVAEVRSSREIIVHQANWLNGGHIHRYTPVRDVSPNNDWSEVRVWYTPGRVYGLRTYGVYGFIYPAAGRLPELRQAAN